MVFNVKYITLATLFVVAFSQSPPQCVLQCSQAALGSATNKTCTSIADTCVCTDIGFQTAAATCLQANCTAADQATAAQLASALCGASNTTATGTSAASTGSATSASGVSTMSGSMTMSGSGSMSSMTVATSGSSSGTGSSSAASPSTSNGANAQADLGFFTLGVAAAGAVVGGLLL